MERQDVLNPDREPDKKQLPREERRLSGQHVSLRQRAGQNLRRITDLQNRAREREMEKRLHLIRNRFRQLRWKIQDARQEIRIRDRRAAMEEEDSQTTERKTETEIRTESGMEKTSAKAARTTESQAAEKPSLMQWILL